MLSGTLILLALLSSIELSRSDNNELCNTNQQCSEGDITEALCRKRNCCFIKTNTSLHNCFQKCVRVRDPPPDYYETNVVEPEEGEIPPPDDPSLQHLTKLEIEKLRQNGKHQLTTAQAVHIANLLERELQYLSSKSSEVNWNIKEAGIFEAVIKRDRSTFTEPVKFATGASVQIDPGNDVLKNGTVTALIFVEYFTLADILQGYDGNELECTARNATVISVTALDENWTEVSISLKFSLHGVNTTAVTHDAPNGLSCEFLDESSNHWSNAGCLLTNTADETVTCACNHTTKFSVLFAVVDTRFNIPQNHLNNILILEYVMEATSFLCLVVTLLSLLLVLRRRPKSISSTSDRAKQRTIVHVNFVIALGLLHLIRLISEAARGSNVMCAITVFASHYFMLASGMWMLLEGLVLYLNLILKSMKFTKLGWMKYAIGWGLPGVIVLTASAIGFSSHTYIQKIPPEQQCSMNKQGVQTNAIPNDNTYEYCWLSITSGMIWSATGPLLAIFAINMFILTHTVYFILRMSLKTDSLMPSTQKSQSARHLWNTTKGIVILFPILGVPWLIGFLVNVQDDKANIVFRYTHVILNGMQGVFIFILYCAVNKEARQTAYRVLNNKWQQHIISTSQTQSVTPRERFRRSISSIMGISTPPNRKRSHYPQRAGSNYSQQSHYAQGRQSSGSGSVNSTLLRMRSSLRRAGSGYSQRSNVTQPRRRSSSVNSAITGYLKRKLSTSSVGMGASRLRHPDGQGCSGSLPRGWGCRSSQQLTRTPSTRSLLSDSGSYKICAVCNVSQKTCRHAGSSMSHLNLEAKDTVMSYYEFQQIAGRELPTLHSRWRRMTAEEFKRFSAIPEEKRRSGVNSFYLEDAKSSTQQAWDGKAKTLERTNISESHSLQTFSIAVDIHTTPMTKKDEEEEQFLRTAKATPIRRIKERTTNKGTKPQQTPQIPEIKSLKTKRKHHLSDFEMKAISKRDEIPSKLSIPTPKHSNRRSERMSEYSDKLVQAIEKWKMEDEKLREVENGMEI